MQTDNNITARTALAEILTLYPQLAGRKLLFAVNQEYVPEGRALKEGDELAVFTAVSGG